MDSPERVHLWRSRGDHSKAGSRAHSGIPAARRTPENQAKNLRLAIFEGSGREPPLRMLENSGSLVWFRARSQLFFNHNVGESRQWTAWLTARPVGAS